MNHINVGPLLFVVTLVGTLLSIIGVIYVFSAMRFLKHAKFWRTHGIAFTSSIVTFWVIICLYALDILKEWGWLFFIYYMSVAPVAIILTLKMRRELRGKRSVP